eukprot:926275-Amphidinium_carterae.2
MNPCWFSVPQPPLFGQMSLDDIVVIHSIGVVGLITLLTLRKGYGYRSLGKAGIKQSVYRAELLAVAHALEECQPCEIVSGGCQGCPSLVNRRKAPPPKKQRS